MTDRSDGESLPQRRPAPANMDPTSNKSLSHNRSLERGIDILRAFRPGTNLLGNGEIAERTGLAPATVSRLTQTLCAAGMLEHDRRARAYRLGAAVLSFSHAFKGSHPVLQVASPVMKSCAEKLHINVGLATADRDEMVYLESFRFHRKVSLRSILTGHRVPVELTSLGRAYLASVSSAERKAVLALIKTKRLPTMSASLLLEIDKSILQVQRQQYCAVSWQPEVVALSTPIVIDNFPIFVLNMSVTTQASVQSIADQLAGPLLELKARIVNDLARVI